MSNLFESFIDLGLVAKDNFRVCDMQLSDLVNAGLSVERRITE